MRVSISVRHGQWCSQGVDPFTRIFLTPLTVVTWNLDVGCHQYVVDTHYTSDQEVAASVLTCYLEAMVKSVRENKLKLSPTKTDMVLVGMPIA